MHALVTHCTRLLITKSTFRCNKTERIYFMCEMSPFTSNGASRERLRAKKGTNPEKTAAVYTSIRFAGASRTMKECTQTRAHSKIKLNAHNASCGRVRVRRVNRRAGTTTTRPRFEHIVCATCFSRITVYYTTTYTFAHLWVARAIAGHQSISCVKSMHANRRQFSKYKSTLNAHRPKRMARRVRWAQLNDDIMPAQWLSIILFFNIFHFGSF